MKITRKISAVLVSSALFAAIPAVAQDAGTGSPGMDELDASVSAESGDELDARRATDQYEDLRRNQQSANDRMDDLERRIKALEDAQS